MRESTNYKFNLPDKADQFNLDHWNQNTKKLDEKLKSIDDLTNDDLKTSLLNFIYPVGSLYWSSQPTDPSTLFGGTWTQIKDKFVLACGDTYSVDATGGNANTTLAVENLPVHSHSFTPKGSVSSHSHGVGTLATGSAGGHNHTVSPDGKPLLTSYEDFGTYLSYSRSKPSKDYVKFNNGNAMTETAGAHTHSITGSTANATPTFTGIAGTTGTSGTGTAFSNMPPYVVKYCWERTA